MLKHPLIQSLLQLEGNPRASVLTEPLWGIPYNLYIPYASVYMLALGVSDAQIGSLASIGLLTQIFMALLSGAITDKLGRRATTFLFDLVAWSIPVLIWAFAQNYYYFLAAVILNSAWRITSNSWTCLLVEDAKPGQLVNIWAWIYISGMLASFVSPLTGVLVAKFDLIPTVRFLYMLAFVMMTAKFIILYVFSTETGQGKNRLSETHDKPLLSLLAGYGDVFKQLVRTPKTMIALGAMAIFGINYMVSGTFWSIYVTQQLGLPQEHIAIYPFAKSIVMLLFFFLVTPHLSASRFQKPMLFGLAGLIVAEAILISMSGLNYVLLLLMVVIEACSMALVNPLMDSLMVLSVNPQERARIMAIMYVITITLTAPFGWIAGQLSEMDRLLPFVLTIVLYVIGAILVYSAGHLLQQHAQ